MATVTSPCFFCSPETVLENEHEPILDVDIQEAHKTESVRTVTTCAKCRPNIMKLFNTNKLRDGRKLALHVKHDTANGMEDYKRTCVHCGTARERFSPHEAICSSPLFRNPDAKHVLCYSCLSGVYTELGLIRVPRYLQIHQACEVPVELEQTPTPTTQKTQMTQTAED